MSIGSHALSFKQGRITANEFFFNTQRDWERMARYLLKRWRAPAWYGTDEVEQELRIAAWEHVFRYRGDEEDAKALGIYLVWNALDRAKKKLHKARGAVLHGNADAAASRFEVPTDFQDWSEVMASPEPGAEALLEEGDAVKHVVSFCRTEQEKYVVVALAEERDLVAAALKLFDEQASREACELASPAAAGYLAASVAWELERRMREAQAA